jgi:hypothetical protein
VIFQLNPLLHGFFCARAGLSTFADTRRREQTGSKCKTQLVRQSEENRKTKNPKRSSGNQKPNKKFNAELDERVTTQGHPYSSGRVQMD